MSYEPGDHIKVEFRDDSSGESEWMWVEIESADESLGFNAKGSGSLLLQARLTRRCVGYEVTIKPVLNTALDLQTG